MAIVHFVNYKRGTQSRAAMRGVMLYVMQEKKTTWEGAPLISGINCQPQSVYDDLGQFTRNYTQTVKRAADNKRRYAPGKGSIPPFVVWGFKGAFPLAHDFACKV